MLRKAAIVFLSIAGLLLAVILLSPSKRLNYEAKGAITLSNGQKEPATLYFEFKQNPWWVSWPKSGMWFVEMPDTSTHYGYFTSSSPFGVMLVGPSSGQSESEFQGRLAPLSKTITLKTSAGEFVGKCEPSLPISL